MSAKALYRRHLAAVIDQDEEALAAAVREVWEPSGVLEFPYAPPDGVRRLDGVEAIVKYFTGLTLFGPFTFGRLVVLPVGNGDEADGHLAEVQGTSTVLATGAPYEQDYVVRFGVSARGRIAWMREHWDPLRL